MPYATPNPALTGPFTADEHPRIGITPLVTRTFFITDIEAFTERAWLLARLLGLHDLANQVLQVGLDWEHLVANTNGLMDPGDPNKVTDPALQAEIDRLDGVTEALSARIDAAAQATLGSGGAVPPGP